jgi:hypothetical protein
MLYNIKVTKSRVKILLSVLFILGIIFYVNHTSMAINEIMPQESDVTATLIPENPQPTNAS